MTFVMIYFAYYGIIKIIESKNDPALRKKIQNILIVLGIGFILLTVWVTSDSYLNTLKENLMYRGINVSQIIQQYGVQGSNILIILLTKLHKWLMMTLNSCGFGLLLLLPFYSCPKTKNKD